MAAAASTALAHLLDGPPRHGRVVAAGERAVYVAVEDGDGGVARQGGVVGILARDAVLLPCALVVDAPVLGPAARTLGARARMGGGTLVLACDRPVPAVAFRPSRWWDPRPRLGAVDGATLATAVAVAGRLLPPWPPEGLAGPARARLRAGRAALEEACRRSVPAGEAAGALAGLGPGSTPSGDDLLAGTLAGARLFGGALGAPGAVALAEALWASTWPLLGRTTRLSAALLAHAARAETCAPAAALCRALAGQGGVRRAVDDLLAVGHTSGHDLATGLLLGATAALRRGGAEVVA